jgi:hypothetical protein
MQSMLAAKLAGSTTFARSEKCKSLIEGFQDQTARSYTIRAITRSRKRLADGFDGQAGPCRLRRRERAGSRIRLKLLVTTAECTKAAITRDSIQSTANTRGTRVYACAAGLRLFA